MGDNENESVAKQAAKTGVNLAKNKIKKYIFIAILPILPYIILGVAIVILFVCIYLGAQQQLDQVMHSSEQLGERVANAVTLHGFRTDEEVEESEEIRFYKRIEAYKKSPFFKKLSDYDWQLLIATLLYDNNYNEKKYTMTSYDEIIANAAEGQGNFGAIVKLFGNSFFQGYTNAYMGNSQYKKANKNLIEVATVIKKCHSLTTTFVSKDFQKCYEGYLVAEYERVRYNAEEEGKLDPEVQQGQLILEFWAFKDIIDYDGDQDLSQLSLFDRLDIASSKVSNFITSLKEAAFGGLGKFIGEAMRSLRTTILLYAQGSLAGSPIPDNPLIYNGFTERVLHYHYNGYIVKFLKEYYKLGPAVDDSGELDVDKVKKERLNKLIIAQDIFDAVYAYCTYGNDVCDLDKIKSGKSVPATGNGETSTSVSVNVGGTTSNRSFNDYVMLYATNKYQEQLKAAIEKGDWATVEAILALSKQEAYYELNYTGKAGANLTSTKTFNKDFYDSLSDSDKNRMKSFIEAYQGKTLRDAAGKPIRLTDSQSQSILNIVASGKSFDEAAKTILGSDIRFGSGTQSPLTNYRISSQYGEDRGGGEHHNAIDFAAAKGSTIYSVSDGVVTDVVRGCSEGNTSCGGGFGNRVYVAYNNGDGHTYYVIYGHMSDVADIKIGEEVSAGSVLGYVGNTGYSFGNHLHLEVRVDTPNKGAKTENPLTFFDLE